MLWTKESAVAYRVTSQSGSPCLVGAEGLSDLGRYPGVEGAEKPVEVNMAVYPHRVETTLTDDLYELLVDLAERRGCTIEELVRAAVVQVYSVDADQARRLAALERLLSLDLPETV